MASLLEDLGWHEWICHSNFSFLLGASHPGEYVDRAVELRYGGLAMTDFDGVYGLARTHLHLARWRRLINEQGENVIGCQEALENFRLAHGVEFRLRKEHELPICLQDTLILIAQSRRGYAQLCALSSHAHRDGKKDAWLPLEYVLSRPTEDLIAIQPMRGLIRRGIEPKELERHTAALAEHFGERFHFAISRHFHPAEDRWIAMTLALAKRLGRRCLLSQDAFFHHPERKRMSDLLHAIRTNHTLDEAAPHLFVNGERCLHSLAGIEQRFRSLPIYEQALRRSRQLAESCTFDMSELRYAYPKEMIPGQHTAQSYLEMLTWEAAKARYGSPLPDKVDQLLRHELALIQQLGFADYFLTVWDIVRWARSQDILCQGRGSAANSAVCFVLGVTSVDPSRFELVFERFLSVERGDPPDIDVDFEHERREEVIQYIYERYGRARAAMVANVITYRSKGAFRAVGKALGIPEKLLGEVARTLEARYFRRSNAENVLSHVRMEVDAPAEDDGDGMDDAALSGLSRGISWPLWAELAESLKGFPRHLGIHSGGFMLADRPLDEFVAQEPATMVGRSVIQWSKEDIEGLGFFKIDVLALGMLTAVRKCFEALSRHYEISLTLATLPQEDGPTYAMIQRADTVGTFQIESRAQMSMLPRLRPRTFYDLVIEVAIIRPGPIQGGMVHPFLRRREGIEPVTFPDERLRPILARTLGIPIFQEQVMRIAMAVGGFSPGQANELRKHMGSFSMKGDMGPWLTRLAQGMRENGIAEEFIHTILAQMKGFADYGFPESHSVSFALIAYASSYLKCHYPAAFFMAVLNSQPMGFYSPHALLQAAGRDGVAVLPVCVERSDWDSTLENIASPGSAPVFGLRLGFRLVTGLRKAAAEELVRVRNGAGGRFQSLENFLKQAPLYRADIATLAAANAFAIFGLERKAAIWLAEAAPFCPTLEDIEEPIAWPEETAMERIKQDFRATSTTLGPHPAALIRDELWCYQVPAKEVRPANALTNTAPDVMVTVFGMVLVKQSPPSAKGMVFMTLEDDQGFINLVFTPQVYNRFFKVVERQAFLCVRGKLQRQRETHSVMVQVVFEPTVNRAEVVPMAEAPAPASSVELVKSRNYM